MTDLQERCEQGQRQLMAMQYIAAEKTLADAAAETWQTRDFDTLARVYMPLQEARRQRRQRAGEGIVCLDLLANSEDDQPDARRIADEIPHGQLLVAGWGSIQPAIELRALQDTHGQYAETLLAAVYPIGQQRIVAIVPLAAVKLPSSGQRSVAELAAALPPESILLPAEQLPTGRQRGTVQTYGYVSNLWERLHTTYLARAGSQTDRLLRIGAYLLTIQVDNACELAHQKLADTAREIASIKAC